MDAARPADSSAFEFIGDWRMPSTVVVAATLFDEVRLGRCTPSRQSCGIKMLCKVCKRVPITRSALIARGIKERLAEIRDMRVRNAVAIFYFGIGWKNRTEPVFVIVVEHCSNRTLREFLDTRARVYTVTTLKLMLGVAAAMLQVHSLLPARAYGAVTSSNFFVTETLAVKISLFPLIDPGGYLTTEQRAFKSARVDPFCYVAPERMRDAELPRTLQTDMYATGIVLWEILTGRDPFHMLKREVIIQHVTNRHREPVRHCLLPVTMHAVKAKLARILNACRRHNPARRLTAPGLVETLLDAMEPTIRDDAVWASLIRETGLTMRDVRCVHLTNAFCPVMREFNRGTP
uniref:Tyrosine protein kinase-like protein n=1 Tax=Rousettus bat poxvirus TaxID=3141933 RepID=A0AAU7E209_9POXV